MSCPRAYIGVNTPSFNIPKSEVIPAGSWGLNRDACSFAMKPLIDKFCTDHADLKDAYNCDEVLLWKSIRPLVKEHTHHIQPWKITHFPDAMNYKQVCEPLKEGNAITHDFAHFIDTTHHQGWTLEERGRTRVLHHITNTKRCRKI